VTEPRHLLTPWPALRSSFNKIASSRWLGYLFLTCLQAKTLWDMWFVRDLTPGDTANYYRIAEWYAQTRQVNIAWSPLYTSFYGWCIQITRDPYSATILHRLLIVIVSGCLVYEVMLRLLPPLPAWLVGAWWIVLPIDGNAAYEVHIFSVIPILTCWLLLLINDSPWMRGVVVGLLAASSFLVRNELMVSLALFFGASVFFDMRPHREARRVKAWLPILSSRFKRLAPAYGLPLMAAFLLVAVAYTHSRIRFPVLSKELHDKQTINIGEVYAFGYSQRHPEWQHDPWLDYESVSQAMFGRIRPTLGQAVLANPGAMIHHFLWNISLIPGGLQTSLFAMRFGGATPDYIEQKQRRIPSLVLSLALLSLWVAGGRTLYRNRSSWTDWVWQRRWCLYLMATQVLTSVLIMIVERPRPPYLFGFTILLMGWSGLCIWALLHNRLDESHWGWLSLPIMILVLIGAPFYWHRIRDRASEAPLLPLRPMHDDVERLLPFRNELLRRGAKLATPSDKAAEISCYLGQGGSPTIIAFKVVRNDVEISGRSLEQMLSQEQVTLLLLDDRLLREPDVKKWVVTNGTSDWQLIGLEDPSQRPWRLYERISDPPTEAVPNPRPNCLDIAP
jgi:hypothetical protein